ncbi:MAG: thymidylate kinase [Oscillospiraceae bacterium]|nr:thymidylate kinase [Oscillospiraceae bacterium]
MGKLIVFEGIDGSGKSTQFDMMCARLLSENHQLKRLVFPRYSEPSSALIRMYLGGEFGDSPDAVNAYAASSFYAVDRYASFVQDWREYYENGGLILTDRYTTSNAIHQGAKVAAEEHEQFFKWLYDYEFNLIGLPSPDMVVYMDIDAESAAVRLRHREAETDTNADIHESDMVYLRNCAESGRQAASLYGWHSIKCMTGGIERDIDDIHNEIYSKLRRLLV